jgi:fatty acid-binding protein DegV
MTPQQIVEELQRHAEVEIERAKALFASGSSNGEIDKQRKRVEAATLAYLAAKTYAKLTEQD